MELALIRLTYLMQALEITANGEGLSKKKLTEAARPVAFRNIPAMKPAGKEAKLIIAQPSAPQQSAPTEGIKSYNAGMINPPEQPQHAGLQTNAHDVNPAPSTSRGNPVQGVDASPAQDAHAKELTGSVQAELHRQVR